MAQLSNLILEWGYLNIFFQFFLDDFFLFLKDIVIEGTYIFEFVLLLTEHAFVFALHLIDSKVVYLQLRVLFLHMLYLFLKGLCILGEPLSFIL